MTLTAVICDIMYDNFYITALPACSSTCIKWKIRSCFYRVRQQLLQDWSIFCLEVTERVISSKNHIYRIQIMKLSVQCNQILALYAQRKMCMLYLFPFDSGLIKWFVSRNRKANVIIVAQCLPAVYLHVRLS